MSLKSRKLGNLGEKQAQKTLQNKGFTLVGRNLKLFCGEIDLLMEDKKDLVIVEVKTKADESFGKAKEMITLKKRKKLLQLAAALSQKIPNRTIRIDVVAIDMQDESYEHLVSAVENNI